MVYWSYVVMYDLLQSSMDLFFVVIYLLVLYRLLWSCMVLHCIVFNASVWCWLDLVIDKME